jgi:hypothetical protein
MFAALCHDIGHNARNNMFHIRVKSALAQKFHFQQVLEKMHYQLGYSLVTSHAVLANLKKGQRERVLHIFKETILRTGIGSHRDLKWLLRVTGHEAVLMDPKLSSSWVHRSGVLLKRGFGRQTSSRWRSSRKNDWIVQVIPQQAIKAIRVLSTRKIVIRRQKLGWHFLLRR